MDIIFLKRRQKICLDLLIKKKRIAQLINEKPNENHHKKPHAYYSQSMKLSSPLGKPTNSPKQLQPQTLNTYDSLQLKENSTKNTRTKASETKI
jgi:hypothetical protein